MSFFGGPDLYDIALTQPRYEWHTTKTVAFPRRPKSLKDVRRQLARRKKRK
jgi:hypothetical protein